MRTSEWIQAGFAAILALIGLLVPLPAHRRWALILLAVGAMGAVTAARLLANVLPSTPISIARDWLPVVLMLVPYWQTGQFFQGPNPRTQEMLTHADRWLLHPAPSVEKIFGRYARLTMEWAYMLCYPLVPLGLATLYVAGQRQQAGFYWFFVLVPTYVCYAITPLFPALPPRSLGANTKAPAPNKSRVFNLWILKHGSIQAISFPSAHVASALAVALVLLHAVPPAGVVFLLVAIWIAVAAVVGGYHYAIDVVLGAAVTLAVFAAWAGHLIPSALLTSPASAFAAPL